jgi:Icc-related predicted phosphoesterase
VQALVFGDLHGSIRAMYARAQRWAEENHREVEVILQVGDFGIYPVPERQEREKIEQYGPGDYHRLAAEGWSAPIPTYFCKGNNEDFDAIDGPLLPGLYYMPDGTVRQFGDTRVAFIGGAWSRKSYDSDEPKPRHVSRCGLERLYEQEWELLISHECPAGLRFLGRRYAVGAPPLRALIENKKPPLVIHGHHHQSMETLVGETRVVSLCRFSQQRPDRCFLPLDL